MATNPRRRRCWSLVPGLPRDCQELDAAKAQHETAVAEAIALSLGPAKPQPDPQTLPVPPCPAKEGAMRLAPEMPRARPWPLVELPSPNERMRAEEARLGSWQPAEGPVIRARSFPQHRRHWPHAMWRPMWRHEWVCTRPERRGMGVVRHCRHDVPAQGLAAMLVAMSHRCPFRGCLFRAHQEFVRDRRRRTSVRAPPAQPVGLHPFRPAIVPTRRSCICGSVPCVPADRSPERDCSVHRRMDRQ
jgi:hypothetical protein